MIRIVVHRTVGHRQDHAGLHTLLGWRSPRAGVPQRGSEPVGYVSVDSTLLSGSLRDNLTLGSAITDGDLFACLSSLGLSGVRFEDLDIELLSDGRGMSSGEREFVWCWPRGQLLNGSTLLLLDDVAGVLDAAARDDVRRVLTELSDLAVIEATVDTPLLTDATTRIELRP